MILLRGLQGFTAGVMIPMAFTRADHVAAAPAAGRPRGLCPTATFGPSIARPSALPDRHYGWQYIFFVNPSPAR